MAIHARQILFQRSLVKFALHSMPIEQHLLAGKPLTNPERDLIFITVLILQASLARLVEQITRDYFSVCRSRTEWSR